MADRRELLGRMRETLADLYDDQASALRVVDDVGLNAAQIERADRTLNFWHSILREAERQGKMDALLELALKEYPARTDLADLLEQYHALMAPQSRPSPIPREPGPEVQSTQVLAPAPMRGWAWLWPAIAAMVVIVGVVWVLSSRAGSNAARTSTPTGSTVASSTVASPTITSSTVASAPTVAPSPTAAPAVTAAPAATTAGHIVAAPRPGSFAAYFDGLADARVTILEPGTNNFLLVGIDLSRAEPIGYLFTLNDQPFGAMRFNFIQANRFFRIESIVDADCQPIENYVNAGRGGNRKVLQIWDTLQLTLGTQGYDLRMGLLDADASSPNFLIDVYFREQEPAQE
jgi:hypothetical protein